MIKDIYDPCEGKPKAAALLTKARRKNAKMSRIEQGQGRMLSEQDFDLQLRTAMTAIAVGINIGDWDCVAEGLGMIQDVEASLRH